MKIKVVSLVIALVFLAVLAVGTQAATIFWVEAPSVFFQSRDSFQQEVSIEVRGQEQTFTDIMPGDFGTAQFIVVNTGLVDVDLSVYLEPNGDLFAHPYPINLEYVIAYLGGEERPLLVGEEVALLIHWSMPKEAGNFYEGTTGQFEAYISASPAVE